MRTSPARTSRGANLAGANLAGANLVGANLSRANLTGAKLTYATMSGAYLLGTNLAGANLTGAILLGADLSRANLAGAKLGNVAWFDTICPNGKKTKTRLLARQARQVILNVPFAVRRRPARRADRVANHAAVVEIENDSSAAGWEPACGRSRWCGRRRA